MASWWIGSTTWTFTVGELKLGTVVWPIIRTLHAENVKELVQEIHDRGLYLFDLWGHVPGSGPEGFWSHVTPPDQMVDYLDHKLGGHFLGIDNGEQDGRYVALYASGQCPSYSNRFRQYLNFHRHFEAMGNDLGNRLSALVGLGLGHYFLKEGIYYLLGAETAQALPNSQVSIHSYVAPENNMVFTGLATRLFLIAGVIRPTSLKVRARAMAILDRSTVPASVFLSG